MAVECAEVATRDRHGDTSFLRVNVWRGQAEHLADSLSKGDRVMVTGRLRQRSWETPDGDKRSVTEVEADEVGASLKWAMRIQAAHSAARIRRHCAWAEPPGRPTLVRTRTATTGRSAPVPASSSSGSSLRWARMASRSAWLSGRTEVAHAATAATTSVATDASSNGGATSPIALTPPR